MRILQMRDRNRRDNFQVETILTTDYVPRPWINPLQAFLNQVGVYADQGFLTQDAAQALTANGLLVLGALQL
jgi:hypothetical protein